jgi:hypothetical protein
MVWCGKSLHELNLTTVITIMKSETLKHLVYCVRRKDEAINLKLTLFIYLFIFVVLNLELGASHLLGRWDLSFQPHFQLLKTNFQGQCKIENISLHLRMYRRWNHIFGREIQVNNCKWFSIITKADFSINYDYCINKVLNLYLVLVNEVKCDLKR